MDIVFQITAGGLIVLAAFLFWAGKTDAAFASAVLGCVSFFLSIRNQAKERNRQRDEQRKREEAAPDQDDPVE